MFTVFFSFYLLLILFFIGLSKVEKMEPHERLCVLTLDEMSLKPKIELDSSGKIFGNVTLPGHTGLANHGLVFMVGGLTSRWKQTVAFHLTGQSVDGRVLKPIIIEILEETHKIGLKIVAINSDMGAANQAMWSSFGIFSKKGGLVSNHIVHPCDPTRKVYFMADVPHLYKNIKSAFIHGQQFTLPEDVVKSQDLPSAVASIDPVKDLAKFQVISNDLKQYSFPQIHFIIF
jgi:hypothetical protein